jgi:hypothetical protein
VIKKLGYSNIVCAIIFLWTYLKSRSIYYDYIFIAGLVLSIWYHWEALKILNGQHNSFIKLYCAIGIVTGLFAGILILHALILSPIGWKRDDGYFGITMFWIAFRFMFAISLLFFVLKTLRIYKRP